MQKSKFPEYGNGKLAAAYQIPSQLTLSCGFLCLPTTIVLSWDTAADSLWYLDDFTICKVRFFENVVTDLMKKL